MAVETLPMSSQHFDPDSPVFAVHRGGKIEVISKLPLRDRDDLSLAYTPGVAEVCLAIAAEPALVHDYTWKSSTVAVVTDGTAVLGLGDIGPAASLPVMEGKALLFKQFGGVDAVPICLDCTDVDDLVDTVARLAPGFGGINLEDISAPRCFEIEERLKARLDIPVFHDDQHGTAIVVLAALENAARLTGRTLGDLRAVVSGAGAAGVAVTKILLEAGIGDIAIADSKGLLYADRDALTPVKTEMARMTNRTGLVGSIEDALRDADVYIGVSAGRVADEAVATMADDAIGDPPRRGPPPRAGRRDRAQRLPQPDQQRARLPRGVPRRARRARDRDHREHEAGGRARPGRRRRRRPHRGVRRAERLRPAGRTVGRGGGRRGRTRGRRHAGLGRPPPHPPPNSGLKTSSTPPTTQQRTEG